MLQPLDEGVRSSRSPMRSGLHSFDPYSVGCAVPPATAHLPATRGSESLAHEAPPVRWRELSEPPAARTARPEPASTPRGRRSQVLRSQRLYRGVRVLPNTLPQLKCSDDADIMHERVLRHILIGRAIAEQLDPPRLRRCGSREASRGKREEKQDRDRFHGIAPV